MLKTDYVYVGMDIHKETHTAVLMTYMEERIGEIQIENNLNGFKRLYTYVEKCRKDYIPMYGLEDVTHYGRNLAIYLLEKEHIVKEVNSNLVGLHLEVTQNIILYGTEKFSHHKEE